jgi:hypothetical protein
MIASSTNFIGSVYQNRCYKYLLHVQKEKPRHVERGGAF